MMNIDDNRSWSSKTREIMRELLNEHKRYLETGSVDRGFKSRLAKKYGLSRGRITNIARELNLKNLP
jgi:hypothetical protein